MTEDFKEQFLAERVRALATVILTRRSDLTIVEAKRATGLDLDVYINREDKPMRRALGVLLRGTYALATLAHANQALGPAVNQFRRLGKFTYPVCLLYFSMRDEQGWFTWLAEPVLTEDGEPKLIHHKKADCSVLTDELLGQIVDRVVVWYDALETVLTAE